jgi:antitoxin ParD1/3/4
MPTRNVVLTDHQAALVEQLVQSGRDQNASEVQELGRICWTALIS